MGTKMEVGSDTRISTGTYFVGETLELTREEKLLLLQYLKTISEFLKRKISPDRIDDTILKIKEKLEKSL